MFSKIDFVLGNFFSLSLFSILLDVVFELKLWSICCGLFIMIQRFNSVSKVAYSKFEKPFSFPYILFGAMCASEKLDDVFSYILIYEW